MTAQFFPLTNLDLCYSGIGTYMTQCIIQVMWLADSAFGKKKGGGASLGYWQRWGRFLDINILKLTTLTFVIAVFQWSRPNSRMHTWPKISNLL
jgi:hypothetical protein